MITYIAITDAAEKPISCKSIECNGSYSESYAKAREAVQKLPKLLFRGIVIVPRCDDKGKNFTKILRFNLQNLTKLKKKLELTPEIIA